MADDDFDDVETGDQNSGGGALRKRLEEALAENKTLRAERARHVAEALIANKGFKYVKPEDITAAPLEEFETVAQRVEAQRIEDRKQMLRETIAESQGLSGDDLELAVEGLLTRKSDAPQTRSALSNAAEVGRIAGTPAPALDSKLFGQDRLRAAFGA